MTREDGVARQFAKRQGWEGGQSIVRRVMRVVLDICELFIGIGGSSELIRGLLSFQLQTSSTPVHGSTICGFGVYTLAYPGPPYSELQAFHFEKLDRLLHSLSHLKHLGQMQVTARLQVSQRSAQSRG